MAVTSLGQVLGLMGAGAFGGLGAFFWLVAALSRRHDDELGSAFGRMIALLSLAAMLGLLWLVFKDQI